MAVAFAGTGTKSRRHYPERKKRKPLQSGGKQMMYGYEEQDWLTAMQEEIDDMINDCGYWTSDQLIRIALLAGGEDNDSDSPM